MSIGAFISVSFATRSLEVAVGALANRLRNKGWLLIAAVMVLFSLLGSTMGFSVETLGFYALFIPLMAALGYDRMTTAAMIILGALTGVMGSTVNPFSIGVAAGEAGVSIGDGIVLRLVLWVLLTAMSVAWVLRYAATRATRPAVVAGRLGRPRRRRGQRHRPHGRATSTHEPRGHRSRPDRDAEVGPGDHGRRVRADDLLGDPVVEPASVATAARPTTTPTHETAAEPYWFELELVVPAAGDAVHPRVGPRRDRRPDGRAGDRAADRRRVPPT